MGGANYVGKPDFIPDECAEDTAIKGSVSNSAGGDIAVRCCSMDGSAGFSENIPGGDASNKGCLQAATYHVAKAACKAMGNRLCTSQELKNSVAEGSGCGHDIHQTWTSDSCGTHVIVAGAAFTTPTKPDECVADSATKGSTSNSYGNDIGIQCCTLDGSAGNRYCQQGVTFDVAEAKCEENGRRLCTAQEVRNDIGQGTGCSHDHRHVWTSTSCGAHEILSGGGEARSEKPVECTINSATTGSTSNSYGNDIGVQCCKQDGSSGYRQNLPGGDASNHGCITGVSYDVAQAACSANNDRLCTKQEVENYVGTQTGCQHNWRHVWTSTICGAHEIVIGSTEYKGDKPVECADDSATTGVASNNWGIDIGVQCCKQDGSSGYRKNLPGGDASNDGCLQGVTYNVALATCTNKGDRLCTKQEVESNIGKGSGCWHDARHVWTSDVCPPTAVGTPKPTSQPTPFPTTPLPTTPKPTPKPTPSPTAQPTPAPTNNPTKKPTYFTASPTESPTIRPTYNTPSPTDSPTTGNPTPSPTTNPTPSPSGNPTSSPTPAPTGDPTPSPTGNPTPAPTDYPTPAPTDYPTPSPTDNPTPAPSGNPTPSPTDNPTVPPTDYPTPAPTDYPTPAPTGDPTPAPTQDPTPAPTDYPTPAPTDYPTPAPTEYPTPSPTYNPTSAPTDNPTTSPTEYPTPAPTDYPTPAPTEYPTSSPSPAPTDNPSPAPSYSPTMDGCDFDVGGYLDKCYLHNASVNGNNIDINGMSKHRELLYLCLNILVFIYVVYANSDYYNRKKRVYKYVDVGMNSDTEQIALKQ